MILERRLQINLAIMTSLGTLLLAVAEGDARLGVLGVAVSASSVYFADVKRWLVLGAFSSNVVGVLALVLTLIHWQTLEREMLFIALANFLTYLQCILHYRAKVQHVYGMLMLLSFLQMAVAAVLASTLTFGLLLLAYLWFAVRTLALFSILREHDDVRLGSRAARLAGTMTVAELFVTPIHRLVLMLWTSLRRRLEPGSSDQRPSRWPLADRPSSLAARRRPGDDVVVLRGLTGHVLKFGLLTLLLAPAVFVVIPRAAQQQGGIGGPAGGTALTGFSDRVMLRDVTRIRENPDEVMRLRAYDYQKGQLGQPYELRQQPWLRGTALGRYSAGGCWSSEEWSNAKPTSLDAVDPVVRDVLPDPGDRDLVLFEVTLERMSENVVFTIEPAHRVPGPEPCSLRKEAATDEHLRPRHRHNSTFTYQMLTTGLKNGRQAQFRPQDQPYAWQQKTALLEPFAAGLYVADEKLPYRRNPADRPWQIVQQQRSQLQGLAGVAAAVLQRAGLDARRNPRQAALALERYLHYEGNYSYSLNPPPRAPSRGDSDPIDYFVIEGKSGHCEYFASALALMLRSQGIPSRLVVGYKGGEWNALAGYYEVRQFEAHAWVEAWIFDDDRPLGWLRLDPTPGEGVPVIPASSSWKQVRNYLDYLWSRYVLGMDASLQEDLWQPLAALFQRESWQVSLHWLVSAVARDGPRESFDWRACLVVIGLQLLLVALYKMLRMVIVRIRSWRHRAALRRRGIPYVEFYVRLERLLGLCGLCRREAQTPWEFAADSAGALAGSPLTMAAAPLLSPIVQAYYRVRFGGPPLTEAEYQSLAEELARLEAIVSKANAAEIWAMYPRPVKPASSAMMAARRDR